MDKQERHKAIRARAEQALRDLYHNATVDYPRELHGRSDDYFSSWFEDQARFEIEYIQDGGSTPGDYRATLAHPANGGKLHSQRAREYYVDKGMRARDAERDDCGALTGWRALELAAGNAKLRRRLRKVYGKPVAELRRHNALWERISEYGTLYQYGRGGRTLAPDQLWKEDGRGHGLAWDPSERSIADCLELIRVVESFNAHVAAWCADVPELWREHCADEDAEARAVKLEAWRAALTEARERRHWAQRDTITL